jgi:hypothetical protein
LAFVPRTKSPLQLAAFTAALLLGFELLLTHWSALYISWFFPFFALAVLAAPELARRREESLEGSLTDASLHDVEPASSPVPAASSDA